MSNSRIPSEGEDLRARLERELEQRRGHPPEPGEIFVLSETAELPVEWALLEARPKAFLAIPADTQPLAGSRDFALSANVLSGPLILRCGHAAEIAASRLRPELRTGLLDPHSLAAARSLQAALAAGTAAEDPVGEEIDRDPEYCDWVEEVLDPARAVLVGLGVGEGGEKGGSRGGEVVGIADWRQGKETGRSRGGTPIAGLIRRGSPWLAAALLAVSLGLGWQLTRARQTVVFDPQAEPVVLGSAVRGDRVIKLESGRSWLLLTIAMANVPSVEHSRLRLERIDGKTLYEGAPRKMGPGAEVQILISRSLVEAGRYRLELITKSGDLLADEDIRIEEP